MEGDVYKWNTCVNWELIIYGLHTGVIQVILNSIEFEMHKQTEIFIIFDSKSVLHRGFASIYASSTLRNISINYLNTSRFEHL